MTHPAVEDRIVYIDVWLATNASKSLVKNKNIRPFAFERAHTRLLTVYGEEDVVLKKFRDEVAKNPSDPLAHYRYGMILARTGDRKNAINHIKTALGKKVFDAYILKDLGITYFNDGRYEEALSVLNGVVSISGKDSETLYYIGRAQIETGQYKESIKIFDELAGKDVYNKEALYFLGEAYGKQGYMGDAHYYLGTYYKKKNDRKNALFHLEKAVEHFKNDKDQDGKKIKIMEMIKELNIKNKRNIQKDKKSLT